MSEKTIGFWIRELVQYGIDCGLLPEEERIYATNLVLDVMGLETLDEAAGENTGDGAGGVQIADSVNAGENGVCAEVTGEETDMGTRLETILSALLADACERGVIPDTVNHRDLFDTKLMGCLTPRPSQVLREFRECKKESPERATEYFYKLSQDCDYIRRYRIRKDRKWTVDSDYGRLDITINLSKPEKDPRAIAMAAAAPKTAGSAYPKCQLCLENQGYAGRLDHPARQTLQVVPVKLTGEDWYMQYSPYVYYTEHCIVFCGEHRPMKISREAFTRLFDFIDEFPHYFIGSNADLPIVGGSILTHDHFQGGHYEFAMERAELAEKVTVSGYEDVEAGIVKWPLSVLRLRAENRDRLLSLAAHVLENWRGYTDEKCFVYANTDGVPHNTITPIARKRDGKYELDLVLRNNITTEEHPLGVYHPHQELHHIKKENIGLIEVMGLAVLPSRLKGEMEEIRNVLAAAGKCAAEQEDGVTVTGDEVTAGLTAVLEESLRANEKTASHTDWLLSVLSQRPELLTGTDEVREQILEEEVGKVFIQVLEDAGVYKWTEEGREGFRRFLKSL